MDCDEVRLLGIASPVDVGHPTTGRTLTDDELTQPAPDIHLYNSISAIKLLGQISENTVKFGRLDCRRIGLIHTIRYDTIQSLT